jgi:hypothetical protein
LYMLMGYLVVLLGRVYTVEQARLANILWGEDF